VLGAVGAFFGVDPGAMALWPPWRLGAALRGYNAARRVRAEQLAEVRPGAEGAMMLMVQTMAMSMIGGGGG